MSCVTDKLEGEIAGTPKRILKSETFLDFLDLEVKRARRYQNFFCLLVLKVNPPSGRPKGNGRQNWYQKVSHLLTEELRESDILGFLGDDKLAAILPYADPTAGMLAKSRFEGSLRYLEFHRDGYEVNIDEVCFPVDGTDTLDLLKKVAGKQPI